MLVFDKSNPDSFDNLTNWIKSLKENADENIPRIIICNKIDLESTIPQTKIKSFMKENNLQIFQSSAKTNVNINEPFDFMVKEVLKTKKSKNDPIIINNNNNNEIMGFGCNC